MENLRSCPPLSNNKLAPDLIRLVRVLSCWFQTLDAVRWDSSEMNGKDACVGCAPFLDGEVSVPPFVQLFEPQNFQVGMCPIGWLLS
jgi:hypothetical protein